MQSGHSSTGGRAVVAARDADEEPQTDEISALAAAAGYRVVDAVTQRRREDTTYNLGRGKAEELGRAVADADAAAVVFDGELTPGQYANLRGLLPPDTAVVDRYRLVLDIFAEGASSTAAQAQVELATLRYELPRLRQVTEESLLNEATEKGSPVLDAERRMDALRRTLDDVADEAESRRERRHADGFDLVAVAGYTNAGKSTLLHRLADDLDADAAAARQDGSDPSREPPADVDRAAGIADRLFETLETTTRRGTVDGRRVLFTDTVGLVDDLPHDLVRSFSATLDEIRGSDAVLAVVDAAAPPETLRRRADVTMSVLAGEASGAVIPVLNKVDRVDDAALAERRRLVADAAPDSAADPVAVSALSGDGAESLRAALLDALPTDSAAFTLRNDGDAQRLLAWLYDRGDTGAAYRGDTVDVEFTGNPAVVAEAERRVAALRTDDGTGDRGDDP
ncbi:GTPase HflX [Halobaculum sp. D14]|uniref:GTPase HflX n=1 Tax=Halobaculum sp. D14 TaxID=3421642 RepID=UPI003EB96B9C